MSAEILLFDVLGAMAVFSALAMVVVARTAVGAVTSLLACLVSLSGVLVLLGAELVAIVQLLVQAGAVTVLLLMIFVLVGAEGGTRPTSRRRDVAVKLVGCLAAAGLAVAIVHAMPSDPPLQAAFDRSSGGQRPMGLALFRQHGFPLQIVSLLLLSAIVGGVALTLVRTDK